MRCCVAPWDAAARVQQVACREVARDGWWGAVDEHRLGRAVPHEASTQSTPRSLVGRWHGTARPVRR